MALEGFSATLVAGRAFSSCLRNGLRMIGMVKVYGDVAASLSLKDVVRVSLKAQSAIHNATVVRSHGAD